MPPARVSPVPAIEKPSSTRSAATAARHGAFPPRRCSRPSTVDFFNAGRGALASMERSSPSGVGDESYYLGAGSMTGLAVRKGNAAFRIHVYSGKVTAQQVKAIEKTLAQQALSKF